MKKKTVFIVIFFLLVGSNATVISNGKEKVAQNEFGTNIFTEAYAVYSVNQDELSFDVQVRKTDGVWQDNNITAYQGAILEFKVSIETTRGYQFLTAVLSLPITDEGPMFDYIENSEQCSKRTTMSELSNEDIFFLWMPALLPATITCTFQAKIQNLGTEKEVLGVGLGVIDNETYHLANDSMFVTGIPSPIPETPDKPNGPNSGIPGNAYTYTTSTTDPNGDLVYYKWNWGDQTISDWKGPYYSGDIINSSHVWEAKGHYNIKVKARDEDWHESEWSDPLSVSMPKNKPYINTPYVNLFYVWFVRGLFKFLNEDDEYIYLNAIYAKLRGFGTYISVYHLHCCSIKIAKPFYGFLSKGFLPIPGIGVCRGWNYFDDEAYN